MTNRQHPFACGLMLKKLTAETTNIEWKPTQIDGSTTRMHKVLVVRTVAECIMIGSFVNLVIFLSFHQF